MLILDKIIEKNISHSVFVSNIKSAFNTFDGNGGKDYFILSTPKELSIDRKIRVKFSGELVNHKYLTCDFFKDDFDFFRKNKDRYELIINNDYGRVYEFKSNPLKNKKNGD
ncbi:MAG: hypothetical protein ACPGSO_00730 [Vicingaceae bacterium]